MTSSSGTNAVMRKYNIRWELYDDETPAAIIKFFEERLLVMEMFKNKYPEERYRFTYGDRLTGAINSSVGPDEGYVVLASGVDRFMLLYNSKSTNGPGIMMRNIIKIELCTGYQRVVYRHPNYHTPTPEELLNEPVAGNIDMRQASRLVLRKTK